MFKIVLIAISSLLFAADSSLLDAADSVDGAAQASPAGQTVAPNSRPTCTSSAGRCTVAGISHGWARLKLSKGMPRTLRVAPPASSGQAPYNLVFDGGTVKDCTSETTCPDGKTLSCSAVGTNTQCQSNATSVGCLTVDSAGEGTGSSASCS